MDGITSPDPRKHNREKKRVHNVAAHAAGPDLNENVIKMEVKNAD